MIANLPKQPAPEEDTICVFVGNDTDQENRERRAAKKKAKTIVTKQSPRKISKTYVEVKHRHSEIVALNLRIFPDVLFSRSLETI